MAGTIGNKNAKGNKGGKPYSKENREKAASLKGLVLDEAIKTMKKKLPPISNKNYLLVKRDKEMVISRILPTCVPREMDVGSDPQRPIIIQFDKSLKEDD